MRVGVRAGRMPPPPPTMGVYGDEFMEEEGGSMFCGGAEGAACCEGNLCDSGLVCGRSLDDSSVTECLACGSTNSIGYDGYACDGVPLGPCRCMVSDTRSSTKYCTAASIVPDLHPGPLHPVHPTTMCKWYNVWSSCG